MADKWIQKAHLKEGASTEAAEKEGKSVHGWAEEHKEDKGKSGRRARLALVFQRMAARRKKAS